MAYAHRQSYIGQREGETTKYYTYHSWYLSNDSLTSFLAYAQWPGNFNQWKATSDKARTHLTWDVFIISATLSWLRSFFKVTSSKDKNDQLRSSRILRGLCASCKHYRTMSCKIIKGMYTQPMGCANG